MILETIVTTINEDGSPNASPMGPTIDVQPGVDLETIDSFELRPFDTSRTFANLKRTKAGVLHITDNSEMFARSAIGSLDPFPETRDAEEVQGHIIVDACRSYEFVVEFIDQTGPRMSLNCRTVKRHRHRDFLGFNRARHAVLEAAILATRLDFLPASEISDQLFRLNTIVKKTGGPQEHAAIAMLNQFVANANQTDESTAANQGTHDAQ